MAAVAWAPLAAHTSALLRQERATLHFTATRGLGAGRWYLLRHELLPAVLPPVTRHALLRLPGIALALASLGFLGLGAQPPSPEWGLLLAENQPYAERAPWARPRPRRRPRPARRARGHARRAEYALPGRAAAADARARRPVPRCRRAAASEPSDAGSPPGGVAPDERIDRPLLLTRATGRSAKPSGASGPGRTCRRCCGC